MCPHHSCSLTMNLTRNSSIKNKIEIEFRFFSPDSYRKLSICQKQKSILSTRHFSASFGSEYSNKEICVIRVFIPKAHLLIDNLLYVRSHITNLTPSFPGRSNDVSSSHCDGKENTIFSNWSKYGIGMASTMIIICNELIKWLLLIKSMFDLDSKKEGKLKFIAEA